MKTQIYLSIAVVAFIFFSCTNQKHSPFGDILQKLEGEWQEAPGVGYREAWEFGGRGMVGAGYMHAGETFAQTESLAIVISDSTLVYQATVPDQNEGQTISFPLTAHTDSTLVFTNPEHDFPNVIAYRFISHSLLHIDVQSLTDSSRNFTLRLGKTTRQ